ARTALAPAFAEVLLLEDCIAACERMAVVMTESGVDHPLLEQLSECIAGCRSYLAARSRESRYAARYAQMCAMVLRETADRCLELDCETSRDCRKACRRSRLLIKKQFSATSRN
ncbi:MAG: hypothetical protein HKO57_15025, partial [Akkermansiaceae bacterium]|nr:hypothetical protein [Akkermansiaceae bacterium]